MADLFLLNVFGKAEYFDYFKTDIFSLSMSDFHPEQWNPCWTVGTILNGLCSFMLEEYGSQIGYTGSLSYPPSTRKELAKQSGSYNIKHFPKFNELFPGLEVKL